MERTDVLVELDDPKTKPARITQVISELEGSPRVELQIDICDPPLPPRAMVGGLVASGKTADDAVAALGLMVADELRTRGDAVEAVRPESVTVDAPHETKRSR